MTEPEAMEVVNEIEALCRKHSLYRTVQAVKRPYLEQVKMEISIKVDGEKR